MASSDSSVTIHISTLTLLKVVLFGLFFVAAYIIRDIILMLVVSMVLASALDPAVDWMYNKAKFPRGMSVILTYLLFIALFGMIIYFLIPPILVQFSELGGRIEGFREEIDKNASRLSETLNQLGITEGISALGKSFNNFVSNLFETTVGVVGGAVRVISVLVFTFYLISSENGMKNFIKSLVPFKHQAYAMRLTDKIQSKIGSWLLGQIILSAFIFTLTFIGLSVFGIKFALALALLAGLLEIVPYLGPLLAAVPAVFVAFVQSPTHALIVVLLYLVIQQIENYILVPKVMGRTVGANPLIILVAVLIGFSLAGIIGMLVSVPIVASVSVFLNDFRERQEQGG